MRMNTWVRTVFGRKTGPIVTRTGRRLGLEQLDDRLAPAVLTVNSLLDTASSEDGYLTLRQAIAIVNSPTLPGGLSGAIQDQISGTLHGGGTDTIVFDAVAVNDPIVLSGGSLTLSVASSTAVVTIDGGDGVTVDGNNAGRVFTVAGGTQATFAGLTITNGNAGSPFSGPGGGGILNAGNLTIIRGTFTDNVTGGDMGSGGGAAVANTGTVTIIDSTFSDNFASSSSGGGGGLYNEGVATVVGSTFAGNGDLNGPNGGAIAIEAGQVYVLNSTFSGNAGRYGSAIFVGIGDAVTVVNSTFANNVDNGSGGNGVIYSIGAVTVINSVFSGNTADGAPGTAIDADNGGPGAVTFNNSYNTGVVLAPLADNGGPTLTHAPLPGSPVIDAGTAPTILTSLTNDSTTGLTVGDATRLVVVPGYTVILIDGEQMLVTDVSENELTVVRGYNGTAATAHPLGSGVYPAFDQRGLPRLINGQIDIGSTQIRLFNVTSPADPATVNAPTVTITGNADADSLVQVYTDTNNNGVIDGGDTLVGSQQLTGGATAYSIDVPLTQDAANNFLVTATPPLGSESDPVDVPTVTEDSTAPLAPAVTTPAAAATVNAPTATVAGTAEAGSLVTVYADANGNGQYDLGEVLAGSQQLAPGQVNYSIVVPLAQDAVNRFVVTAADAAGNVSVAAVVPAVTEDSTAPTGLTVTTPAAAVVVNTPTYTIAGTAEANSLVTVYRDANNNGVLDAGDTPAGTQQLTGGQTSYSVTVPLAPNAVNRFLVTSTDAAANESVAAVVPTVTQDSVAPVPPSVTLPADPLVLNATAVTVSGAAEAGSLVTVYVDTNGNGLLDAGDTVADSQQLGVGQVLYSLTLPLTQDAVNRFLVTSTDAAGNESFAAVVPTVTEDSTAPLAPAVTTPAAAATVNAPTATVAGTAEAGSLVTVYADANGNGQYDLGEVLAGWQQLAPGQTAYSIPVPLAQDAVNRYVVTAADAAGNVSVAAVVPAVTEDSTDPVGPIVTAPAGPVTVNAGTVAVAGTAEAGTLVTVYFDANANGKYDEGDTVAGTQQLAPGQATFSVVVPLAQDAVNRYVVTATDTAGNQSTAAAVPVVIEDSTAPEAPAVTAPAEAAVVNADTIAVAGTADLNSLVTVYRDANGNGIVDDGDTVVGTQQLIGDAAEYTITAPLTQDAFNRFLVTAADVAGNVSATTVVPVITELSTPPAAPVVTGPAARVATIDGTYTLTGTAKAGSLVTVYQDANGNGVVDPGETVAGTQQLEPEQTAFSITVTLTPNAVNQFLATATDVVGQVSVAAAVPNIVQGAPDPGVPLAFAVGADTGGRIARLYNPDGTVRLTVDPFPGATGGIRVSTADANGDGIPDLIVGSGPGQRAEVKVYDGSTGAELYSGFPFADFTGGVFVKAADLDGDGRAELIVTPDEGGGPRVQVIDGATGKVRSDFLGIDDPNFRGGARVTTGDVNGDGVPDLIVAAGFGGGPRVSIFDGAAFRAGTVRQVANFFVFEDTLRNGVYITAGDIDGDGYADIIAGGGPGGGPRVYAISGKALTETGGQVPVANFFGGDPDNRNGIRVATADLDLDGRADVIVGAGEDTGTRVTVYLGKDIRPDGTPPASDDFDAFENLGAPGLFDGGVFVG